MAYRQEFRRVSWDHMKSAQDDAKRGRRSTLTTRQAAYEVMDDVEWEVIAVTDDYIMFRRISEVK